MRWTKIVPVTLGCLLAIAVCGQSTAEAAESATGADLFESNKCAMCHSVAAAGIEAKAKIEKMKGPDLSGYTPTRKVEELFAFATQAIAIDEKKHKKKFAGTEEEFKAILAWLGTLEAAAK
jgi:mono/diheme cytochrome c family protein